MERPLEEQVSKKKAKKPEDLYKKIFNYLE